MTKDEALRLAIESLCCVRDMVGHPDNLEYIDHQVAKIEAALEAKDEPVAHFGSAYVNENGVHITTVLGPVAIPQDAKLYTTPPQRKPLTDMDIAMIDWESLVTRKDCVRAIEAAHGIKGEA